MKMSMAHNLTGKLWGQFAPRIKEIPNRVGSDKISLQQYDPAYFDQFDPHREFVKWAAVEVKGSTEVPSGMESLLVAEGLYAIFHYQGPARDPAIFQHIYGVWLPQSEFQLADRPHYEVLGEKYDNERPDSEEDIYIPVRLK